VFKLNPFLALSIVAVCIILDYFWFDNYGKRWGWIKEWSTLQKGLLFLGIAVFGVLVYLVPNIKFINF